MSWVAVAVGGGTLLAGAYSSYQSNKTARQLAGNQLSPGQLASDSIETQLRYAPNVYDAEMAYRPLYAAADQATMRDSLLGSRRFDTEAFLRDDAVWRNPELRPEYEAFYGSPENYAKAAWEASGSDPKYMPRQKDGLLDTYNDIAPQLSALDAASNRRQRISDITDMRELGPQARQAFLAANPELAGQMGSIGELMSRDRSTDFGQFADNPLHKRLMSEAMDGGQVTPLQIELQRQAMEELTANGDLTPSERYKAQQDVRAANAARGLYDSNGAIGDEVLNVDSLRRARKAESRAFAGAVDAAGLTQREQNRGFALNVNDRANGLALSRADLSRVSMNDAYGREFQYGNMLQSQADAANQMMMGRSDVPAMASGTVAQGGYTLNSGPRMFDPFNEQIMSIYNTNYNAQQGAGISRMNNNAALGGAAMNGIATIGAGYMAGQNRGTTNYYGPSSTRTTYAV